MAPNETSLVQVLLMSGMTVIAHRVGTSLGDSRKD